MASKAGRGGKGSTGWGRAVLEGQHRHDFVKRDGGRANMYAKEKPGRVCMVSQRHAGNRPKFHMSSASH